MTKTWKKKWWNRLNHQRHLDDVADELIAEQTRKEQEKLNAENKEWKDKMDKEEADNNKWQRPGQNFDMKGISQQTYET